MIDRLDIHAYADRELAPEEMARLEKEIAASPDATRELDAIHGLKNCLQTKVEQADCARLWTGCIGRLNELDKVKKAEYFVGKWAFEWDVPEGPLGPSGRITGTTTYKKIDDRFFEADTDASGPGGAFRLHETLDYNKDEKFLSRHIADSRGFGYLQSAAVTGDAGGVYYIYLESSPFTFNGHTVRIKHNLRLLSPLNYRVAISVSDNGGPFVNYGNPWWRKQ